MGVVVDVRRRLGEMRRNAHLLPSDVLLASFPKSGNTWVRFIWANLVSLSELGGRTVDFHTLDEEVAPEYDSNSWGTVVPKTLSRLVKTHREYDPRLFAGRRAIYIWRHPGDVAISYFHYLNARNDTQDLGGLSEFLRHRKWGLPAWCKHVANWLLHADLVIRYEDLSSNTENTMREVLGVLGGRFIDDQVLQMAIERSSFEHIRALEVERGLPSSSEFKEGFRFTRMGTTGGWQEEFSKSDCSYIREEVERHGLNGILEEL